MNFWNTNHESIIYPLIRCDLCETNFEEKIPIRDEICISYVNLMFAYTS